MCRSHFFWFTATIPANGTHQLTGVPVVNVVAVNIVGPLRVATTGGLADTVRIVNQCTVNGRVHRMRRRSWCDLFRRCATVRADIVHVVSKELVHAMTIVGAGPKRVTATIVLANAVKVDSSVVGTTEGD